MVEKLGAKIIFRTERSLFRILESLPCNMQVIAMDEVPTPTDYYVPILSLPLIFKTTLENIPSQFPYLSADKVKSNFWRSRIEQIDNQKLRVGLVWAGAPRPQKLKYRGLNSRRDIPLKMLSPLLKEDVQFFSLQKGDSAKRQLIGLDSELKERIIDWTDELGDFSDTAALIDNLDVVVCVDTSTAHLAGAMNKPTFLLNRKDTCWRWLETGDQSPWYPSLTVFRQTQLLRWDDVIQNVISSVRKLKPTKIPI
jgi:hypothetical protein